jgi:anti-anti-sigma factor
VSGGAILGDRIRMSAALDDDGVYVRSLASQGHMGGLSPAAVRVIDALDAGGFEIVLIETVGTGQTEIDVAEVADVRVVVAAPGLGDGIQAMKAGILELGTELFGLVELENRKSLLLNFAGVEFLSSAALGKLITLDRKVKSNKGRMKMSNIRPEILEVFQITKLNKIFDIRKDEAEAVSAFE